MNFLTKISSLKEKASYNVALNLSQDSLFKEVAMCLEKPTYGISITDQGHLLSPLFISNPELLLVQTKIREAKMKKDACLVDTLSHFLHSDPETKADLWDIFVEEQCQRLTDGFPSSLKHELHVWIYRFALEYLSYSRRQESLFGVSRYFLMDILIRDDWTESGRLNEEKIAKRLLRNKQMTNVQKYCMACVYCFDRSIPRWWNKLTEYEKQSLKDDFHYVEYKSLISFWCNYMDTNLIFNNKYENYKWQNRFLWRRGANMAVCCGNKTALVFFWKKIYESDREWLVTHLANRSLKEWKFFEILGKRKKLFSNDYCSPCEFELNLPHFYSDLVKFFLSEMCEREIVRFFEQVFEDEDKEIEGDVTRRICTLEYFLDWPLQDYFLSIVNLLWGRLPMNKYGSCLLLLVSKYCGDIKGYYSNTSLYSKIHFYDYENMLWNLWNATPYEYKQHVFYNGKEGSNDYNSTWIGYVLFRLVEKDPFENRDVALFKRIWLDVPQELRRAMIELKEPQKDLFYANNICWKLLEKEKWSLANWLLKGIFSNAEIFNYKKMLIESRVCYFLSKMRENYFKFVEDLIDWCLFTDSEKAKYKYELLSDHDHGSYICSHYLTKGEFITVEKIIDFCISSSERKEEIKIKCAESACLFLVNGCEWELMDNILIWSNKPEKEIQDFKKSLFSFLGLYVHFRLLFVHRDWKNVKYFYKWFCLSPEEIIKIKKETVFSPKAIKKLHKALYEEDTNEIDVYVEYSLLKYSLRWCLTSEEILINFQKKIVLYFNKILKKENDEQEKKCFYLISELLYGLREEIVLDVTLKEDTSMKDKGEKRFLVTEDGSSSAKRLRHKT